MQFLKTNKREFDCKIEMLCYYNLSCAHQTLAFNHSEVSSVQECIKYAAKALEIARILTKKTKGLCWFKVNCFKVRLSLQYCALLSQIEKHSEAL